MTVPTEITLLHQDEALLVVVKPAGMLTHNSAFAGPPEVSLMDALQSQVPGPLHAVHRLDRGCSGVLVVARSPSVARALQDRWHTADTRKLYRALVRGHLTQRQDVDHPVKDEDGVAHDARSRVFPVEDSTVDRCSVVDVELLTGRNHQVRRHLKHLSHPILGDSTHGKGSLNREYAERYGLRRLGLHAMVLRLVHPVTGAAMQFSAPLPEDFLHPLRQLFSGAALDLGTFCENPAP